MPKAARSHRNNPEHNVLPATRRAEAINVPALIEASKSSLRELVKVYFLVWVAGQAAATFAAKKRDLKLFLSFYVSLYGHDDPAEWFPSVTKAFIKELVKSAAKPSAVVRTYATVRHFARWTHQHVKPFPLGCPTEGVKPPAEAEPEWKGLTRADELRLLNAAQTLRLRPQRGTNQGVRDHAITAVLLGSGLRVSELLGLDVNQYDGRGFINVLSKGTRVRPFVPVQRDARAVLEEWRDERGQKPGPLFTTRTGNRLGRSKFFEVLQRIAKQANAHRQNAEPIDVSPHVLRHTFLRKLAEEKGVHYAKEASGHKSDKYIWRYVKPDRQTLADAVDELD